MRSLTDADKVMRLMRELGRGVRGPGRVYLTGGASAVLIGWRTMTVDADLKLEPEPPVEGNAYEKKFPKRLQLPATLWEAAQRLKASKMAREWLGDAFVDHYAATREWEEREFRKHITDWEMERYFEII